MGVESGLRSWLQVLSDWHPELLRRSEVRGFYVRYSRSS